MMQTYTGLRSIAKFIWVAYKGILGVASHGRKGRDGFPYMGEDQEVHVWMKWNGMVEYGCMDMWRGMC